MMSSVQFADDCTNVIMARTEDKLQEVMELSLRLYQYFCAQGMKLKLTKAKHIVHWPSMSLRTKTG